MSKYRTYSEKLRDPKWQRLRLEKLEQAGWSCEHCDNSDEELHVHHRHYVRGRDPWEYELDELQVLCKTCHKAHHDTREELDRLIGASDPATLSYLLGYLRADAACWAGDNFRLSDAEQVGGAVARFAHRIPGYNSVCNEIPPLLDENGETNEPAVCDAIDKTFPHEGGVG